jgi:hypothetical protein
MGKIELGGIIIRLVWSLAPSPKPTTTINFLLSPFLIKHPFSNLNPKPFQSTKTENSHLTTSPTMRERERKESPKREIEISDFVVSEEVLIMKTKLSIPFQ